MHIRPGPLPVRPTYRTATAISAWLLLLFAAAAPGAPRVAVSIQPVHSLAAGVMRGISVPKLIVEGRGSPHGYQMRPSDATALYAADVVFWMGVPLENFLQEALANVRPPSRVVTLLDTPGLMLLTNRSSGVWDERAASTQTHTHEHTAAAERERDPHAWLSPANAVRLTERIAETLAGIDPQNAARYGENAGDVIQRIVALEAKLKIRLAPLAATPFVMFHDAFQYFEHAFYLNSAGALHLEPDRKPGARRLRELRAAIRTRGVRCVFREPQFHAALVDTLIEGSQARVGVVDPLGAEFPPGPDAWFQMMEVNAEAMVGCLGDR